MEHPKASPVGIAANTASVRQRNEARIPPVLSQAAPVLGLCSLPKGLRGYLAIPLGDSWVKVDSFEHVWRTLQQSSL
jgi:hypothetical protein